MLLPNGWIVFPCKMNVNGHVPSMDGHMGHFSPETSVLVRVLIVMMKHHDKKSKSGQELKQGMNLEPGADAEAR